MKHRKAILVGTLFVLVAISGFILGRLMLGAFSKLTLSDYHVYYYVSKMVFSYETHPYSNFKPIYPYYFPPASLLLFWGLSMLPFYISKIVFTVINALLYILSIFLINKMILGKTRTLFWILLIIGLLFYPLRFTFTDGQFNVVMLAIFTVGLYALKKAKPVLGGISVGLGVITKISPAIIAIYGIWKRKFNFVMVAGVAVILLSLASEYTVKKDINYYYAKFVVREVSNQSSGMDNKDQSLLGFIKRVSGESKREISSDTQSIISYSIVFILGLIFLIIDIKVKNGEYGLFIDYFILTIVGVVGTGLSWYHQYTILLLPLFGTFLLCLKSFDKKFLKIEIIYVLLLILVYFSWMNNLKTLPIALKGYSQFIMFYGSVVLLAALYLLKIKQNKWLVRVSESRDDFIGRWNMSFTSLIFLLFIFVGMSVWEIGETLKEGRDLSRIEAIDSMSKALTSSKVSFKVGESSSYATSNRVGAKGYVMNEKGQDWKVSEKMSVLYIDPVNDETYNYKFISSGGKDFILEAQLESKKYIEMYGDVYYVNDVDK